MKHCPICGAKLDEWQFTEWGWGVMESGEECPNGHYSWEYSYGSTFVAVGDKTWMWSYDEPSPRTEIDAELRRER